MQRMFKRDVAYAKDLDHMKFKYDVSCVLSQSFQTFEEIIT